MKTYSPLESIHRFCLACEGGSGAAVADCADHNCPFYAYRHGTALPKGHHAPLRACKRYCHEYCQADAAPGSEEVRNCKGDKATLSPCPVFPFRLGRNPNISDATKQARRERAQKRMLEGTHNFFNDVTQYPLSLPGIDVSAPR